MTIVVVRLDDSSSSSSSSRNSPLPSGENHTGGCSKGIQHGHETNVEVMGPLGAVVKSEDLAKIRNA